MSICRARSYSSVNLRLVPSSPSIEEPFILLHQQQSLSSSSSSSSFSVLKRASSLLLHRHQQPTTTTTPSSSTAFSTTTTAAELVETALEITEITTATTSVRRPSSGTVNTTSQEVALGSTDCEVEYKTIAATASSTRIGAMNKSLKADPDVDVDTNTGTSYSSLFSVNNPLDNIESVVATETNEPPKKKQKVDQQEGQHKQQQIVSQNANASIVTSSTDGSSSQCQSSTASSHESLQDVTATDVTSASVSPSVVRKTGQLSPPPAANAGILSSSGSTDPASSCAAAPAAACADVPGSHGSTATSAPLKALTFAHLRTKYVPELEYMLREFRKLERQLLGAKGAAKLEESAGSRERREKLHTFILHLDDTVRQIELGCKLEADGEHLTVTVEQKIQDTAGQDGSPLNTSSTGVSEGGAGILFEDAENQKEQTTEKEHEENVQKIEEHILANLLPVKVRLKKQLAAQQGATQNPAGMPALRRGSLQPPSTAPGKGTFAEAAEKRRQEAEAARLAAQEQRERAERRLSDPTQFGKPLSGGGSALTKNLHGSTLGSTQRIHGHGVGSAAKPQDVLVAEGKPTGHQRRILYAGMVPQSTQQESGLSAASGVHDVMTTGSLASSIDSTCALHVADPSPLEKKKSSVEFPPSNKSESTNSLKLKAKASSSTPSPLTTVENQPLPSLGDDVSLTAEDSLLVLRKKRRKRKLQRLARRRERERNRQHAASVLSQPATGTVAPPKASTIHSKAVSSMKGPKKGPKSVEYICALCSETYTTTNDYNPWWALSQHDCPKCRKMQIPRLDINSPANAIDYHPALLAHLEENGGRSSKGSSSKSSVAASTEQASSLTTPYPASSLMDDSESDTDLSELSDDELSLSSMASDDTWPVPTISEAERAEFEHFGYDYRGPIFTNDHAAKLLVLMSHASTCPCKHKSKEHRDTCRSVKYMMLHVRDCPGTTANNDVCPFPWCRKTKHLLYHLVSCNEPEICLICSPKNLPKNLQSLVGLNRLRAVQHREAMIKAQNAALVCKTVDTSTVPTAVATATGSSTHGQTEQSGIASSSASAVQESMKETNATESSTNAEATGTLAGQEPEVLGLGATKASDEQLAQAALAAAATVNTAEMEKDPSTQAALAVAESTKLTPRTSIPSATGSLGPEENAATDFHVAETKQDDPVEKSDRVATNGETSSSTVASNPKFTVSSPQKGTVNESRENPKPPSGAAVVFTDATNAIDEDVVDKFSSFSDKNEITDDKKEIGPDKDETTGATASVDSLPSGMSSAPGTAEADLPRTSSAVRVS